MRKAIGLEKANLGKTKIPRPTGRNIRIYFPVFGVAHKIANAYRAGAIECEGVNLWISDGEAAGQEVPHVHLHIVPRHSEDSYRHSYDVEPRNESKRSQLDAIAARIQQRLCNL